MRPLSTAAVPETDDDITKPLVKYWILPVIELAVYVAGADAGDPSDPASPPVDRKRVRISPVTSTGPEPGMQKTSPLA